MARSQQRPDRVAQLSRSESNASALLKLNLLVASSLDVGTVLREIMRAAAKLMEAKLVGVWVADERACVLELRALSDERLLDELPNEREVLQLVAEGRWSAEIGARLHLSPRTVETHRASLMRKLGLRTRTDLVRYAVRHGILPLE